MIIGNKTIARFEDKELVKEKIMKFKVLAETADLTDRIVDKGLTSKFSDFENSLQYCCAVKMDCNIIITRNVKGFKESDIPVLTPDEYLSSIKSTKKGRKNAPLLKNKHKHKL